MNMLSFAINMIYENPFCDCILVEMLNYLLSDGVIQIRKSVFCGPYCMNQDSDKWHNKEIKRVFYKNIVFSEKNKIGLKPGEGLNTQTVGWRPTAIDWNQCQKVSIKSKSKVAALNARSISDKFDSYTLIKSAWFNPHASSIFELVCL